MVVVHSGKAPEFYIAQNIMTDKHIVPIQFILNNVGRYYAIVAPIRCELLATGQISDEAVGVPQHIPW